MCCSVLYSRNNSLVLITGPIIAVTLGMTQTSTVAAATYLNSKITVAYAIVHGELTARFTEPGTFCSLPLLKTVRS